MLDLQVKALQLLVVEAFAGTYHVAQVLRHLKATVNNAFGQGTVEQVNMLLYYR
jgi:hypothetical protein